MKFEINTKLYNFFEFVYTFLRDYILPTIFFALVVVCATGVFIAVSILAIYLWKHPLVALMVTAALSVLVSIVVAVVIFCEPKKS